MQQAVVITGRLEGWYGLDRFADLLREVRIPMPDTKPAPNGIQHYVVGNRDDIVVTITGFANFGYAFAIHMIDDSMVVARLWEHLTRSSNEFVLDPGKLVATTFPLALA